MATTTHLRARRAALALASFALAACSALAPQITPERLIQRPGEPPRTPPATLDEAYDAAAELQRHYATAVMDQGNATPQLAAGLLGLSAFTLFKGITSPNTRDIAAAGVLGSAGWAAHSSLISQPRLEVYRAGVEALQCAMAAVAPLKPGQNRLGQPTDAAGQPTLYGLHADAFARRDALRALTLRNAYLKEPRDVVKPPARDDSKRLTPQKPPCRDPGANASAVDKLKYQRCREQPPRPVEADVPAQTAEMAPGSPPAALLAAFQAAQAEQANADARIEAAEAVMGTLEAAAPALWAKTVLIYTAVSREVQQTTPNIASVLAAAKGMKDVASGFSGLAAAAGQLPVIPAQSGGKLFGPAMAEDEPVRVALEQATTELRLAVLALDQLARRALGTGHEQARAELSRCAVKASGVTLTVTPAGERRDLPLGTSAVFFVAGGSGVPLASVINGPRPAGVVFQPEGGLMRFVFTPPSGAAVGEEYTLRFSDGGGSGVEQTVVVRLLAAQAVAAAAAPAGGVAEPVATAPAAAASTAAAAAREIFFSMSESELKLLKLDKSASDDAVRTKLQACQKSAGEQDVLRTLKADAALKTAVIKALQANPARCVVS